MWTKQGEDQMSVDVAGKANPGKPGKSSFGRPKGVAVIQRPSSGDGTPVAEMPVMPNDWYKRRFERRHYEKDIARYAMSLDPKAPGLSKLEIPAEWPPVPQPFDFRTDLRDSEYSKAILIYQRDVYAIEHANYDYMLLMLDGEPVKVTAETMRGLSDQGLLELHIRSAFEHDASHRWQRYGAIADIPAYKTKRWDQWQAELARRTHGLYRQTARCA
jgi:hypothetical protein